LARLGDCAITTGRELRRAVLVFGFLAPVDLVCERGVFETLVLANAIGFGVLFMRGGACARSLVNCSCSAALAAFGLPQDVGVSGCRMRASKWLPRRSFLSCW